MQSKAYQFPRASVSDKKLILINLKQTATSQNGQIATECLGRHATDNEMISCFH